MTASDIYNTLASAPQEGYALGGIFIPKHPFAWVGIIVKGASK